jgi:hypothetical protein
MTVETLLVTLERRTEIPICSECHLPIITGQLTDQFERTHLECPKYEEARRCYLPRGGAL